MPNLFLFKWLRLGFFTFAFMNSHVMYSKENELNAKVILKMGTGNRDKFWARDLI
jgi:hypothetical protein